MLSKAQIKYIQSLRLGKYRQRNHTFIAEGVKVVHELLHSDWETIKIYAVSEWLDENESQIWSKKTDVEEVDEVELKKISQLNTPNQVLALVKLPSSESISSTDFQGTYLALDDIRDPGNMGTIIRTADWFGAKAIFCSKECVDIYNPKVVQATMGSLFHLPIYTADLSQLVEQSDIPSYAATLGGSDVNNSEIGANALIIIGNESRGIAQSLAKIATHQIAISKYGKAESLNAAIATGILLSKFTDKA